MSKAEKQKRLSLIKKTLLPDLVLELEAIKQKTSGLKNRINQYEQEAVNLTLELTPPTPVIPKVSDHALVRYLERHHKFDLDMFRNEILTADRIAAIQAGCTEIKANGLRFKVQDNVVVTVL